jgi:hypothetical protein
MGGGTGRWRSGAAGRHESAGDGRPAGGACSWPACSRAAGGLQSAHRAVLADALAALNGLLVGRQHHRLAVECFQLDVLAQLVVEEAAGAVLGLGAAPVLAGPRLAVGVDFAYLACGREEQKAWTLSLAHLASCRVWAAQQVGGHSSQQLGAHHASVSLTPAAGQAAAVDASAVDVRLVIVPDVVGARGAERAQVAKALACKQRGGSIT